jgi:hypothetical protein
MLFALLVPLPLSALGVWLYRSEWPQPSPHWEISVVVAAAALITLCGFLIASDPYFVAPSFGAYIGTLFLWPTSQSHRHKWFNKTNEEYIVLVPAVAVTVLWATLLSVDTYRVPLVASATCLGVHHWFFDVLIRVILRHKPSPFFED